MPKRREIIYASADMFHGHALWYQRYGSATRPGDDEQARAVAQLVLIASRRAKERNPNDERVEAYRNEMYWASTNASLCAQLRKWTIRL